MIKLPIVKVSRWYYRATQSVTSCCRLETFVDSHGRFSILVTELSDNRGPSVTDSHGALCKSIIQELKLPAALPYEFYERFDRNSYAPPRDDLCEVTRVALKNGVPHWFYVPDEEWDMIYANPKRPRPKTRIRKAVNQNGARDYEK
ncbi:MAG TPA: hypothetical protein VE954_35890 [Oligoflexus sp.]|nr:hypothetical protein [Oligoflexus sp.]